jgi:type IV pilus assembly protein PilX
MIRIGGGLAVQRGMALIISLIILLSLTLLGLAAIQNTSLEERMAGNTRAENIALQAAEAGLRAGEAWIALLSSQPEAQSCNKSSVAGLEICVWESPDPQWSTDSNVWPASDDNYDWWEQRGPSWWSSARSLNVAGAQIDLAFWRDKDDNLQMISEERRPRYIVEERGLLKDTLTVGQQQDLLGRMAYQITSRGLDEGGRGEAIVRSTVVRRF